MEIIAYAIATPYDFYYKNPPPLLQKSATLLQKSATLLQKSATSQHAQNPVFLRCKWRLLQKSATTQHGYYKNPPILLQKSATSTTKIRHFFLKINPIGLHRRIL